MDIISRPPFFTFGLCSVLQYTEAEEQRKTGKAWEHLIIMWTTSGGREVETGHMVSVLRPSLFTPLFRFHVLYWKQTEEQKRGRSRNEAILI